MDSIRTEPLAKEEKAELTALLAMLQVLPQNGRIILHCNNGNVAKVESVFSISCNGKGGREEAEERLQRYKDSAKKAQAAGDTEWADRYQRWAVTLEKILAERQKA